MILMEIRDECDAVRCIDTAPSFSLDADVCRPYRLLSSVPSILVLPAKNLIIIFPYSYMRTHSRPVQEREGVRERGREGNRTRGREGVCV
jgi:hypothetical protein